LAKKWDWRRGTYIILDDQRKIIEKCSNKHDISLSDVVRRCIKYLNDVGEIDDAIERYEVTK